MLLDKGVTILVFCAGKVLRLAFCGAFLFLLVAPGIPAGVFLVGGTQALLSRLARDSLFFFLFNCQLSTVDC